MKKDYYYAAKIVASSALLGNLSNDVIRRMVEYITIRTIDSNIICSLLKGLVVDAKISNKEKFAEIIGKYVDDDICEIKDLEVIASDQSMRITYVCKRFAKTADETRNYETKRKQDEAYAYEVKVSDSCRINVNEIDWEDAVDFEVV